ncbi:unnamed protein product, partial [Ixodes persulcatus]
SEAGRAPNAVSSITCLPPAWRPLRSKERRQDGETRCEEDRKGGHRRGRERRKGPRRVDPRCCPSGTRTGATHWPPVSVPIKNIVRVFKIPLLVLSLRFGTT